jgi:hypothetical protein
MELIDNENHKLTTAVQLNHPNDNAENVNLGTEYWWKNTLAMRGGYKINVDEESFSLGIGLKLGVGFWQISTDYAFILFGRLGNVHRFALNIGF